MARLAGRIAGGLQARATEQRRQWWTRYLKGTAVFRGVAMGDVRRVVDGIWERELSTWAQDDLRALVSVLLHRPETEDKLAGILLLAEHHLDALGAADLQWLREPFADGAIADWNSCDWHAVKVLGALCARDGRDFAAPLAEWTHDGPLWQRRAPAAALAAVVARPDLAAEVAPIALDVAGRLVSDSARFAQTGAGWLLRELSLQRPALVEAFVADHADAMSREAGRMATARLRGAGRR